MTETEFQKQVTDLAEILGWSWVHFRPAQTSKGWRTPVSGPLGKGWVDLILAHPMKGRMIFAELKTDKGKVTADQAATMAVLAESSESHYTQIVVWRPADFDEIVKVLQ